MGLASRKAIYIPFPQAVPSTYTLDAERCLNAKLESDDRLPGAGLRPLRRGLQAQGDRLRHAARDRRARGRRHRRRHRIRSPGRRTGHRVRLRRASRRDGRARVRAHAVGLGSHRRARSGGRPTAPSPKDVVFIQCVGSRNPDTRRALLLAHLLHVHRQARPAAQAQGARSRATSSSWTSRRRQGLRGVRPPGHGRGAGDVHPRPGQPGRSQEDGKLKVMGVDTLSGRQVEINADMVVLATAMVPTDQSERLASTLRIAADTHGFSQGAAPQAASGGDPHRGHLPRRRRPGAEGHPRHRVAGLGRGGQEVWSCCPSDPAARPHRPPTSTTTACAGLLRVPPGLPLRGHRAQGNSRPRRRSGAPGGVVEPGDVRGLRRCAP